jgi:predicted DNA-binding transcriptional regulator AlpA
MQRDLGQMMDEKIDEHDVARYLGVNTRTIRTLIKRSQLPPPIRIGRKQFWLKDKFTRWLRDGGTTSVQMRSDRDGTNVIARRGRPRLPA